MAIIVDNRTYRFEEFKKLKDVNMGRQPITAIADFLEKWYGPEDMIQIPTSGSTGKPQLKNYSKESILASAEKTAQFFKFKPGQKALLALPVKYVGGQLMVVRAIVADMDLYAVAPSSQPLESNLPSMDFVPLTVHQFHSSYDRDRSTLNKVKNILLGGGPVSSSTQELCKELSCSVYHGYGMTETLTHIALRNITLNEEHFTTLPGIKLSIGDQSNLIITAPHLEETVVTTDCVELLSDSSFIWLGRIDNIINTGAVKINPETVENKLEPFIEHRFFIGAVEDERLGQKVALVVECAACSDIDLVILGAALEKYERPKVLLTLPKFSMTDTGKIKRNETILLATQNK